MYSGGYKNLKVWEKAMSFTVSVYEATKSFPTHEMYGLTSQMRRGAVSIASNIAEGCARQSKKEFAQFISIANGSLAELLTQAMIAKMIGILPETTYNSFELQADEIGRMLNKLKTSLTTDSKPRLVSTNY